MKTINIRSIKKFIYKYMRILIFFMLGLTIISMLILKKNDVAVFNYSYKYVLQPPRSVCNTRKLLSITEYNQIKQDDVDSRNQKLPFNFEGVGRDFLTRSDPLEIFANKVDQVGGGVIYPTNTQKIEDTISNIQNEISNIDDKINNITTARIKQKSDIDDIQDLQIVQNKEIKRVQQEKIQIELEKQMELERKRRQQEQEEKQRLGETNIYTDIFFNKFEHWIDKFIRKIILLYERQSSQ